MTTPPIILSPVQRRRRMLGLAVILGCYVLSFFQRFAPAAIAPDLIADFAISAASMGALASTYFYVYTVIQVPTGVLVDTIGVRRILFAGALIGGVGSLLFGLAPSFALAFVGRTLIGLGVSVVFIAMLKYVAVWFDERRFATVAGLCILLGNSGSVLAGAPQSLLAQAVGWRSVFVGVGLISLLLGVACWVWVRDRPQESETEAEAKIETPPVRRGFDRTVVLSGLLQVLRNPATWPCVIACFGICGTFFAFAGLWAVPYLIQAHGMPRDVASNHLSLLFAGFAVGGFLLGSLSDRIGRRKPVLIVGAHLNGIIWLVWASGVSLPLAVSYSLFGLMGIVVASFTLTWVCAKELNPPLLSGMSTSVVNMGGFLSAALLQPLVGWIMDQQWQGAMAGGARLYAPGDYRAAVMLLAGVAWLGAVASWRVRETRCRNIWMADQSVFSPDSAKK